LRFPGFEGEWEGKALEDISERQIKKNKSNQYSDVFTNSATQGVVRQNEYFDKDIANQENLEGYYIIHKDDFVYNPRISISAPVGPIKRNHIGMGVMSPLYTVFKFRNVNLDFVESYFETTFWHIYMKSIANYGVRHDRMNITNDDLLNMPIMIPSEAEQQKIASFLTSVDERIQQLTREKYLLEQYKKGVMHKIFSRKIRFKDNKGKEYTVWEEKILGDISERQIKKNTSNEYSDVFTNSATQGVVRQFEYFDKDIANQENLDGYYIIHKDDFVYNPRISVNAPVGPIKRNHIGTGVMSPLYTVFRFRNVNLDFIELYFETTIWHKYMKSIANYGARHDRMNITNDDLLNMPIMIPSGEEQQKIASFLTSIDKKIELVNIQLEKTKAWKKGLLQKMFV